MNRLILLAFTAYVVLSSCSGYSAYTGSSTGVSVLTYNIHHANPPSKPGVIDIDAIANVIKQLQPQLVTLQELDIHTKRSGVALHEAEELGRLTGMQAYFFRTINYDGGEYGIGILSKYPLTATKGYHLPTVAGTNGEPRGLVTAEVELPGNKKIVFACTHLDAQRSDTNRLLQVEAILDILRKETLPVIIAGDFNAIPASPVIRQLDSYFTRSCSGNCEYTIPETNPNRTIDYIAYAPASAFRITAHKVIAEQYASDHRPVMALLKLQ